MGLPPAIGSHRVLGDGRSTLLLTPDAEVDWWCAPSLDSPPVLWSLLDPGGARATWRGTRLVRAAAEPAGPASRTTLALGRTRIEVWDGLLPINGGGSALVRLVRSIDEAIEVVHELTVGGFDGPPGCWSDTSAHLPHVDVHLSGGRSRSAPDGVVATRLQANADWSAVVVSCGPRVDADPAPLVHALRQAETAQKTTLGQARLPRHHPERAREALAVLEACTDRASGAIVAAPTTSLPEAPGGDRQFDYRFTWLRDASLAVSVASLLGDAEAAKGHLSFVHRMAGGDVVPTHPLSDIRGGPVPEEREVEGVGGWAGSSPVRVGNAAGNQVQLDALGLLLEAVSVYLQTGGSLDDETWHLVARVADHVAEGHDVVSNGIWELRRARPLVSADIGRWIALDRAVWIARGWRPLSRRRHWKRARKAARDRVIASIRPDGSLPQAYDDDDTTLDASGLMAVLFGLLARDDPRALTVVDTTIAGLGAGPYLYRYQPGGDDGFTGREGTFTPTSWWAAAALAQTGRLAAAQARVDELCAGLPALLAEELDPASGASLGNVPLVWAHMEAARTTYILDAEAKRARYGSAGLWTWRLARYVSLRRRLHHPGPAPHRPELAATWAQKQESGYGRGMPNDAGPGHDR
ncbi:MAG TPA: glycoside hydrolase family 15 protein [Acidimicrobiales bacterium]|nr:glycoside hydrolase family 15 protein [Acidimicrobiales bacterium]